MTAALSPATIFCYPAATRNDRKPVGDTRAIAMLNVFYRCLLLALAAIACVAAIPAARAGPVLGYVANKDASPDRLAAFKKGLGELGHVEGRNLKIEYRYARIAREYDAVMAELVARKVDIIVASNALAAPAAAKATRSIPIVLAGVNDPVGLGVADSLEHTGRNVTGTTIYAPHLIGERIRIFKRLVPALDRVAMLTNGNNPNNPAQVALLTAAAKELGIEVLPVIIRLPADVGPAMSKAVESGAQGFLNCVDPFINSQRFTIAALAARSRRPTIFTDREYVLAGGLMALGVGHLEGFYRAAGYVDKILRGADPADLPIALPTELIFSVSRSALRDTGMSLPKDMNDRVTEWLP